MKGIRFVLLGLLTGSAWAEWIDLGAAVQLNPNSNNSESSWRIEPFLGINVLDYANLRVGWSQNSSQSDTLSLQSEEILIAQLALFPLPALGIHLDGAYAHHRIQRDNSLGDEGYNEYWTGIGYLWKSADRLKFDFQVGQISIDPHGAQHFQSSSFGLRINAIIPLI